MYSPEVEKLIVDIFFFSTTQIDCVISVPIR